MQDLYLQRRPAAGGAASGSAYGLNPSGFHNRQHAAATDALCHFLMVLGASCIVETVSVQLAFVSAVVLHCQQHGCRVYQHIRMC